jgi:lipoate-protein ligase A
MELSVYGAALDSPERASALSERLVAEARSRAQPLLCVYTLGSDVLSLGRFHAIPPPRPASGVRLLRRRSGGRPAPLGDGYLALALALPHPGVLTGEDPAALAPSQILNRSVRGLLGALESLGVSAHYPGRDVVTTGGRLLAALGFETAPDGATLVEACIAVRRSFAVVTEFADRADPDGVVPIDLVLPDQATSIAEAGGRAADLDDFTAALATGYAGRSGIDVVVGDGVAAPAADGAWLEAGRIPPHLDRHAVGRDMLGVLEVYVACDAQRVGDVRLCGDLIAPSATVARLEAALRDAPIDRAALRARALDAVEGRGDVLLGVRSAAMVGDLVYTACTA